MAHKLKNLIDLPTKKITIVPDDGKDVDTVHLEIGSLMLRGYSLSTINKKLRRLDRPATAYDGLPGDA